MATHVKTVDQANAALAAGLPAFEAARAAYRLGTLSKSDYLRARATWAKLQSAVDAAEHYAKQQAGVLA